MPTIHKEDTIAQQAELPRDLSGASVTFRVGDADPDRYTAVIQDAASGLVAVPLSQIDWDAKLGGGEGSVYVDFEVTFDDGTVEIIPPGGDTFYIYD